VVKVVDTIVSSIRTAASYNPDVQTSPVRILWPDKELARNMLLNIF
jgi:hypothetical protein